MKILYTFLTLMLTITIACPVYAADQSGTYIATQETPSEVIDKAKLIAGRALTAHLFFDDRYSKMDMETFALGTPFKLNIDNNNIFYFPILADGAVIFTLSISDTDDTAWSLSEFLANGLNKLENITSANNAADFEIEGGDIYAKTDNNRVLLESTPNALKSTEDISAYSSQEDSDKRVVNILEKISDINISNSTALYSSSHYINLDMAEIQSTEPWCAAFCGASILRCRYGLNIYAYDIIRYFNPNSGNLFECSISDSQMNGYAQLQGASTIYTSTKITQSTVKTQIQNDRPIYISCANTSGDGRHALVIRGYYNDGSTLSIWNPWWNYYFTHSYSNSTFTLGTSTFNWDRTICNW